MYCPYKLRKLNPREWTCEKSDCQAWEPQAKYNHETKEHEGDCRLCMIERKVSGGVNIINP